MSPGCKNCVKRRVRRQSRLFLEQIFKGLASIDGASRARSRSLFLYAHAHGVESTLVALILAGDSLRDRLAAFETAGSIEVRTLAAGV